MDMAMDQKRYGFCLSCNLWIRRDEMLSINLDIYNRANDCDKLQLRLCGACHRQVVMTLERFRWNKVLRTRQELLDAGVEP